jgi:predicted RNA methylase
LEQDVQTAVSRDPSLDQWWTPPEVARWLIKWAGIGANETVLEPGAGSGALVRAMLGHGVTRQRIRAVEIDRRLVGALSQLCPTTEGDFPKFAHAVSGQTKYDIAVMNPPYSSFKDADVAFVLGSLLLCDRVVALVRLSFLAGVGRYEKVWSQVGLVRLAVFVNRPKFHGADEGGSPRSDYCAIEIVPKKVNALTHPTRVEWVAGF